MYGIILGMAIYEPV
jgi:hypothetical protein